MGSAMLPGTHEITLEHNGMRGTMRVAAESGERNQSLMFVLTSINGTPLEKRADLRYAEVSLSAGSWLPLHDPFPFSTTPEWMTEEPLAVNAFKGSSRFYNLGWVRNATATVHVQMWPPSPLLQVKIPLGQPFKSPIHSRNGSAYLSVAGVRDSKSSGWPPQPCLAIAVDYSGTGRYGYASSDFRVQDDQGKDLDANATQINSSPGNHTWFDVIGVSKNAKYITFSMYSPRQLRDNTVDFRFAGLATP